MGSKKPLCERCGKEINVKFDNFFRIETFESGQKVRVGWLHKACNIQMTQERIETQKMLRIASNLTDNLNQIMGQMGLESNQDVFEVK